MMTECVKHFSRIFHFFQQQIEGLSPLLYLLRLAP
jgi:hypothetical protein